MAYTPKNWQTGEIIEAEELNHMEQGIAAADAAATGTGTIGTQQLANGSVTTPKIAPATVTNDKLDQEAVDSYNIRNGAITTPTIYDGAVTTAKIADGAITDAKLAASGVKSDVSDLKSAVDANLLDFIATVNPTNWFNNDGLVAGESNANGTVSASTTRKYTDYFIPVTEGDKVYFRRGDNFGIGYMRHMTAYDADKNLLASKGSNSSQPEYTIQSGVAFVKITIDNPNLSVLPMITVGANAPTVYSAYFDPYKRLTKDYLTESSQAAVDKLKNGTMNSLALANRYACSMPLTRFRQTVGIAETFYGKTARTPDETTFLLVDVGIERQERVTADNIHFPNAEAFSSANGFNWRMYDSAYAEIYNNLTSQYANGFPRSIIAENLSSCTLLAIGDSTVDQDTMTQKLLDHFTAKGATLTLLGTLGSGNNKNEGRAGWKASDYLTDRQYYGVTNPFYNPSTQTFDFNYYMTNQGYSSPDFVVIQLGINDLGSTRDFGAIWGCIKTMIDSILAYDNAIKIILNLPTTPTSDQHLVQSMYLPEYKNRVVNYDAYAITHSLSEYTETKVRCSYCHIILDPSSDIFDNVHPNATGYEKMALEIANQINHWQNDD